MALPKLEKSEKPNSSILRLALFYFLLFSYFGHLLEAIIMLFGRNVLAIGPEKLDAYEKILSNIIEPYTIYGTGAVIFFLFEYYCLRRLHFRHKPLKYLATYAICTIICAVLEFSASFYMVVVWGNNPYWNYSNQPFNFFGHICLVNTLFFGLISFIFVSILPSLNRRLEKAPNWLIWALSALLGVFFLLYQLIFR